MTKLDPANGRRKAQRRELHDAILTTVEVYGASRDGGWREDSPFIDTALQLQEATGRVQIDHACNRLHAALFTVNLVQIMVSSASQKRLFRFPEGEIRRRAECGASSLPTLIPEGISKAEFEVFAQRLREPIQSHRMHPDSARILKGYLGHEAQTTWALEFFGQAMVHAYEDITGNTAGLISKTSNGARGPATSFVGFMSSIIADLCESEALPGAAKATLFSTEVQAFTQAVRTMPSYKRKGWGRLVDFVMSANPSPMHQEPQGTGVPVL